MGKIYSFLHFVAFEKHTELRALDVVQASVLLAVNVNGCGVMALSST